MSSAPISLFCLDLPFYKTSPGIPIHFLICSMACNEEEPGPFAFAGRVKHTCMCAQELGIFLENKWGSEMRKSLYIVEGVGIDLRFSLIPGSVL